MRIILASASPRRKELLEMIGVKFEIITSNADETFLPKLTIEEQSQRLAYIKAKAVYDKTEGERIVIGSDTLVVKDGKIYGKPQGREDAIAMLKEIQNGKHKVITSICVLSQKNGKYLEQVDYDITEVTLKKITDEEIEEEINKVRENNSRMITIEDRAVEDGDTVTIDFDGYVDGEQFEGGMAEDYSLVIGSHTFIDNFEEQLIGKNIGDDVEVNVTFPDQYQAEELRNKEALFKVKINAIKMKELPDADD